MSASRPFRALRRAKRKPDPVRERHALVTWANSIAQATDALAEYNQAEDGPQVDYFKGIIPIIIASSHKALLDCGGATFPHVLQAKKTIAKLLDFTISNAKDGALFADSIDDSLLVGIVQQAIWSTKDVVEGLKTWAIVVTNDNDRQSAKENCAEGGQKASQPATTH